MALVPLANCKGQFAIVDEDDWGRVQEFRWHLRRHHGNNYAQTNVNRVGVPMHVFLLGQRRGFRLDHKNGNGLDNRKENLRFATFGQNNANGHHVRGASKYKGVSMCSKGSRWTAAIQVKGIRKKLGIFLSEEGAAKAYDDAAVEAWGEFACINFPNGKNQTINRDRPALHSTTARLPSAHRAATETLRAMGVACVRWGDSSLLLRIALRAGYRGDEPKLDRLILGALTKAPGELVRRYEPRRLPTGRVKTLAFFLPECA